ncbi:MAG: SsrA-binding protein SmpB [Gemmatimonadetes bacterium]|nr:SsrA-binding protein SmpB [Gemmatimonadota bacterium]
MSKKTVARNKKAFHEYHILDTFEAGIVLVGPEVKSIRAGKVSLAEAFARVDGSEAFLYGMHISPYDPASTFNVDPIRTRKLLLNRREIRKLIGATQQEGFTLVPLELYLNDGYVKVALALGRGKKQFDKREDVKKRDAQREMQRAIRRG